MGKSIEREKTQDVKPKKKHKGLMIVLGIIVAVALVIGGTRLVRFLTRPEVAYDSTYQFDMENGTVALNNGMEMPIFGIGTYMLSAEEAENSVYHALLDGYHLIDTANAYMNEKAVGRGIRKAIDEGAVGREDIFVTAKIWPTEYERMDEAINETLDRLGLEYLDLVLLHQPFADYITGYQGLEKAVADGRVRAIGLSNFYKNDFDAIMEIATITPAVLQIETHPYYQEAEMREYVKPLGTVIEAWFPLGGRGHTQELFNNETISAIAQVHGKSSAQVILRWHLQAGDIAIPGSSNPDHIQENIEIFDFELSADEMEQIRSLDRNDSYMPDMPKALMERMIMSQSYDFDDQR